MKRLLGGALVLFGSLFCPLLSRDAHARGLVYIGGGDEHMGAYDGYLGAPDGWAWVRAHADGYYINTFPITTDANDATQNSRLSGMSALFTNKNVFYETELDVPNAHGITDSDDVAKLAILQANGFKVTLTTCNLGVNDSRMAALRTGDPQRPVLAMGGPWTIDGDINSSKGDNWRSWIMESNGSATDSPLALWETDGNQCREASYSDVKFTHSLGKQAMIMMCPHKLGTDANWFKQAKAYIAGHEDNDAIPDVWAISYYAAYLEAHTVTPEQVNGAPAETVTGVGYYLIHHLRDPDGVARLTVPAATGVVPNAGGASIDASSDFSVKVSLTNTSAWLDLIPVLHTSVRDPNGAWDLTYQLDGADVTADVTGSSGVTLYKSRRLAPSSSKEIVVSRKLRAGASATAPLEVTLTLTPHPSEPTVVATQVLQFGVIDDADAGPDASDAGPRATTDAATDGPRADGGGDAASARPVADAQSDDGSAAVEAAPANESSSCDCTMGPRGSRLSWPAATALLALFRRARRAPRISR